MFETLTITLREGIEAALVIGIILAYISKTNNLALKRHVYFGIISAIVGSIATAIVIQMLKTEWSDFMDGLMFFVAAFFLASMLIWMHRTSKHIRKEIEQGIENAINKWNALGVIILTFIMIYREGAEIVLFLSATTKQSSPFVVLEGAIGLILASLFGYMFIKGSKKMNLERFFEITGIMLVIIIFKLFVGGIHEWSEVGVISLSPVYMNIIGPLVKDSASIFFTGIMLGFLVLLFVMIPWNQIDINNLVGIEKRKALGVARRERNRKIITGIIGGLLISTFVVSQISALPTGIDPVPEKLRIGNVINIPASTDVNLHKYVCDMQNMMLSNCPMHGVDGKANVRILAIQKTDGTTAVAYDACNLCGAVGFVQDGDQLICKKCGAPIDRDSVGQEGGCNPIPVRYMVNNSQIIIKADDIGKSDLFK